MANSISDLLQSIRAMLFADPTVVGLVADRVQTAHTSGYEGAAPAMPLVVVAPIGGTMGYAAAVQAVSLEIYVYSRISEGESLRIYEAVHSVLQAARIAVDGLDVRGVLRETQRPRHGYNDNMVAFYVRATWAAITTL